MLPAGLFFLISFGQIEPVLAEQSDNNNKSLSNDSAVLISVLL